MLSQKLAFVLHFTVLCPPSRSCFFLITPDVWITEQRAVPLSWSVSSSSPDEPVASRSVRERVWGLAAGLVSPDRLLPALSESLAPPMPPQPAMALDAAETIRNCLALSYPSNYCSDCGEAMNRAKLKNFCAPDSGMKRWLLHFAFTTKMAAAIGNETCNFDFCF